MAKAKASKTSAKKQPQIQVNVRSQSKSKKPELLDLKELKHDRIELKFLLLDKNNPRFGSLGSSSSQADILDKIVEKFGVDDVLSSLAVNGYFDAEPIVCRKDKHGEHYTVIEGNRRLAACLIITGDDRASRQIKRTNQYQDLWKNHGSKTIDPVPVIIFDDNKDKKALLSYLGVRHIASSQPWDSYAKAAWVAQVVQESNLPLTDIALMIGDHHKTINRLLEGFYFVQQLVESGDFRPEDSIRKGRGSVTEYPFSWIYTILQYSTTRRFLDLPDDEPKKNPIPKKNLKKAGLVAKSMFGDKGKGQNSAITDSRELGELASALVDPEKVTMLEQGRSLDDIIRLTKPLEERLRTGLAQVREIQSDLLSGLAEDDISIEIAASVVDLALKNKRSAGEIEKKLREVVNPDYDDK